MIAWIMMRQWNIECALCILVPANKSVSDAILSATGGRVKSIDGNPNDLWSFWAQAPRQLKDSATEKIISNHREAKFLLRINRRW